MTSRTPTSPEVRPGSVEDALRNGRVLLTERPDLALSQAHAILRRDPQNPPALRLAAAAHRKRGEKAEAESAELAAIQFSQNIPALKAAAQALSSGGFGEASRLAAEHLKGNQDDLAAVTLSAESALALDLPEKAEPLLRHVVERAPGFVPAEKLLVSALIRQDKFKESRDRLETLVERSGAGLSDLALLARVQADGRDLEAAAATYERILQQDDSIVELWVQYGDTLRFLGRRMESELAYRRALALDPHAGQAWWSLVNLDPSAITGEELANMQAALEERTGDGDHSANLHFALGAVYDSRGDHSAAFRHFQAGNDIRKVAQPYDPAELSHRVDATIRQLEPDHVPAGTQSATAGTAPIFILGMPRSGSTLVERVLGRHSSIEALGELSIVPHLAQRLRANSPQAELAELVARLPDETLGNFSDEYRARAAELKKTDKPYFTDKLHMNWQHIGLILRLFPEARLLDVRRGALDCCWSNYKVPFSRGHPAASDLTAIARFYRDYVRMMDHVEKIAPGRVLRVDYEALLTDFESWTRRMLEHIGVPFETDCLEFHRSTEPVATASSEQVRRPLNREGVGAWKPYEPWLGPLFEALGPLADADDPGKAGSA